MNVPLQSFEELKPLNDWVLARMYEHEESAGGIIIPETARAGCPPFLEIVSVGPGEILPGTGARNPPCFKPGDFVVAVKAHYPKVYVNCETLYVMRVDNIAARVMLGEDQKKWVKAYKAELDQARKEIGARKAGLTLVKAATD